jgi:hypothetical protein
MTAPIASGWSGCRVGLAPLESAAFARRTPIADFKLLGPAPPYRIARRGPLVEDSAQGVFPWVGEGFGLLALASDRPKLFRQNARLAPRLLQQTRTLSTL